MEPQRPAGRKNRNAFGWGILGGVAVAAAGFLGHALGNRLYPQPMEQVPSDLLLVPFGLAAGFGVVSVARRAARGWSGVEMWSVIVFACLVYGALNFSYAKGRALPPGIRLSFDPEPAAAERCRPPCPGGAEWTVQGTVVVRSIRRSGTIKEIGIGSSEMPPPGSNTVTNDPGLARFRGPNVTITQGELPGDRAFTANDVLRFPIRYSYRNRGGESARQLIVTVLYADENGHTQAGQGAWHVQ